MLQANVGITCAVPSLSSTHTLTDSVAMQAQWRASRIQRSDVLATAAAPKSLRLVHAMGPRATAPAAPATNLFEQTATNDPSGSPQRLARQVLILQRQRRCRPMRNALVGGVDGACLGLLAGWIPTLALAGPSHGISFIIWPLFGAGLGLSGTIIGATGRFHFNPPAPDSFRLHLLSELQVVATRRESEQIVHTLQAHGVLHKGRNRYISNLSALPAALATLPQLKPTQRDAIAAILDVVAKETQRREPYLRQAASLLEYLAPLVAVPLHKRSGEDTTMILRLVERLDYIETELSRFPAEAC